MEEELVEEPRKEVLLRAPSAACGFVHKKTGLEFAFFFVKEDEKSEYGQSAAFGETYVIEVPEKQNIVIKMSETEAIACTKNGNVFVCTNPDESRIRDEPGELSVDSELAEMGKWTRVYLTSLAKAENSQTNQGPGKNKRKIKTEEDSQNCHFCGKTFGSFAELTEHRRTVHTRHYRCKVCGLVSSSMKRLTVHMRIHTGEKPFHCKYCEKSFATYLQLYNHNNTHEDKRPHLCDECGKGFRTAFYLTIHQKRHKGIKQHKCQDCDKAFVISSSLLYHRRRCHTNERPFTCESCQSSFITNFVLRNHQKRCPKQGKVPVICQMCGCGPCKCPHSGRKRTKKTGVAPPFVLPYGAVEGENGGFKCTVCDLEFPGQSTISVHMRKHQAQLSRFMCLHCIQTFETKADRKAHVLEAHAENRLYKCDHCDKRFFKAQHLRSHHISIHQAEKAYTCPIPNCNKSFSQPYNLEAHRLLHIDRKLYRCVKCQYLLPVEMSFGTGGRKLERLCTNCPSNEFELVRNVQTIRQYLEEPDVKMIPLIPIEESVEIIG